MAYDTINMSTTIIKPNPIPKTSESQFLINRITVQETIIPADNKMKATFTKILASVILFCKKLLPTNLWMLSDRPMIAIFAKISEIDTNSENVPITSVVVILANKIKKIYPEIIDETSWI